MSHVPVTASDVTVVTPEVPKRPEVKIVLSVTNSKEWMFWDQCGTKGFRYPSPGPHVTVRIPSEGECEMLERRAVLLENLLKHLNISYFGTIGPTAILLKRINDLDKEWTKRKEADCAE